MARFTGTTLLIDSRTEDMTRAIAKAEALREEGLTATIISRTITTYYLVVPKTDAPKAAAILRARAKAQFAKRNADGKEQSKWT